MPEVPSSLLSPPTFSSLTVFFGYLKMNGVFLQLTKMHNISYSHPCNSVLSPFLPPVFNFLALSLPEVILLNTNLSGEHTQQKGAAGERSQHVCRVHQSCKERKCPADILYKTLSKQFHYLDKGSWKHLRLFLVKLGRVNKRDSKMPCD